MSFNPMQYVIDGNLKIDIANCQKWLQELWDKSYGLDERILHLVERAYYLGAQTEGDPECPLLGSIRAKWQEVEEWQKRQEAREAYSEKIWREDREAAIDLGEISGEKPKFDPNHQW
jgi:hypothetical protein